MRKRPRLGAPCRAASILGMVAGSPASRCHSTAPSASSLRRICSRDRLPWLVLKGAGSDRPSAAR
jgi:hypothetical protein